MPCCQPCQASGVRVSSGPNMARRKVIPKINDLNLWAGAREALFAIFSYSNSPRDLDFNSNWIQFLQWVHKNEGSKITSARRRMESFLPSEMTASDRALDELSRGLGKLFKFHKKRPIPENQQRTFVIEMLAGLPSFKGVEWSEKSIQLLLPLWNGEDIRYISPRSCLEAAQLKVQSIPEELNPKLPSDDPKFAIRSPSSFTKAKDRVIGYPGTFAPDEFNLNFIRFILEGLWKVPASKSEELAIIIKKFADQSELVQERHSLRAIFEALEKDHGNLN